MFTPISVSTCIVPYVYTFVNPILKRFRGRPIWTPPYTSCSAAMYKSRSCLSSASASSRSICSVKVFLFSIKCSSLTSARRIGRMDLQILLGFVCRALALACQGSECPSSICPKAIRFPDERLLPSTFHAFHSSRQGVLLSGHPVEP